jgi:hypothetical protein
MASPNQALADLSAARFQTYPPALGNNEEQDFFAVFNDDITQENERTTRGFSQAFKDKYSENPLGHYEDFELFMTRVVPRLLLRSYPAHNFVAFVQTIHYIQYCNDSNHYAGTRIPPEIPLGRKDMDTGYVQTLFKKFDEMTPVEISQLIGIEPWVRSYENAGSWMRIALKRALDKVIIPQNIPRIREEHQ